VSDGKCGHGSSSPAAVGAEVMRGAPMSPKKAFAMRVEALKPKCGTDFAIYLDRLATDLRMQSAWNELGGHEEWIDRFLDAVLETLLATASVDETRALYDQAFRELREVKRAIETISGYCARLASKERLPEGLRALEPMLHELGGLAHAEASIDRTLLGPMLPNSRKSAGRFLLRVHFPRLMTRHMVVLFDQPHYQVVADTTNVFFGFPENDSLTASHVRDAWRRHELGYSCRQSPAKSPRTDGRVRL
jgi:hypothetical protein